jgi:MFS family permease
METQAIPRLAMRGPRLRRAMNCVTWAWVFGSVWATATAGAPLTEFACGLGFSNLQFGILSALPFVATLVCLPAAFYTEREGNRKRLFMLSLFTQRLLWIPIGLIPFFMARHGHVAAARAADGFLILMFLMYAIGNAGGPAWTSWMADLVPERARGKYFSRRRQMGIYSGIPAAILAGWIMDRHARGPISGELLTICAIIFLCAVPFGVLDIFLFNWVPDIHRPRQTTHWIRSLGKPLRESQFLWFAGFVATLTLAVSFMGQFVTLYLVVQLHASNLVTQLITLVAPMVAQLAMLPVWGKAVDRMGKKPVLAISAAGLVPVGLGWCFMTTHRLWLGYLLSALGGMLYAGAEVANFNLVLEMSATQELGREGDSSFFAVNAVIINIAGCIGGVAAGIIAQNFQSLNCQPAHWGHWIGWTRPLTFFDLLFGMSALLRLIAVVIFLPRIRENTARPAREAIRFMMSNIYNNLFQALLQPLRIAGFQEGTNARKDGRK